MSEPGNGRITNADLYDLITARFDAMERRLGMVERRVGLAPDQQQALGVPWSALRLALVPVLVGCVLSGCITAAIYAVVYG